MVDIHSHILPDQDDGARTFEDALSMVRMAAAAGTTDIVASPHANSRFAFDPTVVERKIAELQRAAGDAVRIHYGCDFHLTPENIEDAIAAPGKYSIDHKGLEDNPRAALTGADLPLAEMEVKKRNWFSRFRSKT